MRAMRVNLAFRPRLIESLQNYSRADLRADLVAGLTVGVVALPLAMAFAIASLRAGAEIVIDLTKLPPDLAKALTLPRFLRADVSLDEASPETASVQAFLIAATGGGGNLAEPVAKATPGDPHAAQIVHPRVAAARARPQVARTRRTRLHGAERPM